MSFTRCMSYYRYAELKVSKVEKRRAVSGGRTECALANVPDHIAIQSGAQFCIHSNSAVLSELAR